MAGAKIGRGRMGLMYRPIIQKISINWNEMHLIGDVMPIEITQEMYTYIAYYLPPGGSPEREIMKCSLCVRASVRVCVHASVSVSHRLL